ncbi:MAG: phosphoenolpyruvate carboxykinase (ATP), partial [Actinobacteria bacterium]|nr:phosphoenolpyruvate carboxykinase (ATP) [Actinomycetota bacterium]
TRARRNRHRRAHRLEGPPSRHLSRSRGVCSCCWSEDRQRGCRASIRSQLCRLSACRRSPTDRVTWRWYSWVVRARLDLSPLSRAHAPELDARQQAVVDHRDGPLLVLAGPGTGKTTLSADPDRLLIGDDETAWTQSGLSNLEDGCYAKLIDLDKSAEPVIAAAMSMKGTLIENVPALPGKAIADTDPQEFDLTDGSITENTRFAYPLDANPNVREGAAGPHPETIVLLTADAFGVLPPVSILDGNETMYHFVMGFTSKLAGTEVGVTEPEPSFSSCFGAAFMSQKPAVYAELLAKRMAENNTRCIMLNTGWTGGPYGKGKRMSLKDTRALLDAALNGEFDGADLQTEPTLGVKMPITCAAVDDTILNPRGTWEDPDAYDEAAARLRDMFRKNFARQNYAELGIQPAM